MQDRRISAIASASSWAVGATTTRMPASALAKLARPSGASSSDSRNRCQCSVLSAGRSASLTRCSRARAVASGALPGTSATSSRATPSLRKQLCHAGLRVLGMLGKHRPAFLVEGVIETRQHDGAVRQRGDDLEQPRRRRHGAGRSRGDHGMGRAFGQPFSLQRHQHVAAGDRRDQAVVGEILRPLLGDDLEELDGASASDRQSRPARAASRLARSISSTLDDVHQPGEVGGETTRPVPGHLRRMADRLDAALGRALRDADAQRPARAASARGVAAARRWPARRSRRRRPDCPRPRR